MADVLKEQWNPTSTIAKCIEERAHRAKEEGKSNAAQSGHSGKDRDSSSSNRPHWGRKKDKKDRHGSKGPRQGEE